MTMRSNWTRTALAAVLALAFGAEASLAADRCDLRGNRRDDRAQYQYNSRGYGNNGYRTSYPEAAYRDYGYRTDGYRTDGYRNDSYYEYGDNRPRSAGKSAAIIGGSAAAGAAVGALTGGGKGAAIGAAVGAVGGLVYDRATRNSDRYGRGW
jgi:hypothetical protein